MGCREVDNLPGGENPPSGENPDVICSSQCGCESLFLFFCFSLAALSSLLSTVISCAPESAEAGNRPGSRRLKHVHKSALHMAPQKFSCPNGCAYSTRGL